VDTPKRLPERLMRVWARIRAHGLSFVLKDYARAWIRIIPFYYIKEVVPAQIPDELTTIPEGFEFSEFNREDVLAISTMAERKDYIYNQYVLENFDAGDTCIGIKYNGEIAAFTWYSLERCRSGHYPVTMGENEAYLYDMYVLRAFRGHNLAPILRYKNYEVLKRLGRDTFYSITERSNAASLRFKQKLGARIVFLGLCIVLRNDYNFHFILKRY